MGPCGAQGRMRVRIRSIAKFYFIFFVATMQCMVCVNIWVHYDLKVLFVSLHITLPRHHHYADLSKSTDIMKCLPGVFCRVCV